MSNKAISIKTTAIILSVIMTIVFGLLITILFVI
jgi:hypothetical protein